METTTQTKQNKAFLIIILALFVVAASVCYAMRAQLYVEMVNLKLVRVPEHYTELYFQNPTILPKYTVKGEIAPFTFTIHNLEGATTTYPYRIYFKYPSGHIVILSTGTTTLADNGYQNISHDHTFLESDEVGQVVVELTSLDQRIDFLVPNTN